MSKSGRETTIATSALNSVERRTRRYEIRRIESLGEPAQPQLEHLTSPPVLAMAVQVLRETNSSPNMLGP